VNALIEPVFPQPVALAPVNVTVPKFASGRTLPLDGASAIHSAELNAYPLLDCEACSVQCFVLSLSVIVTVPPETETSALIESPGETG